MKDQRKKFEWLAPTAVAVAILLPDTGNAAQRFAAIAAALLAGFVSHWSDRLVWEPLLKKAGLWRSSLFLVGALVMANFLVFFLVARLGTFKTEVPRLLLKMPVTVFSTGFLFGWGFAAIRGAQNPESPRPKARTNA